MKIHKVREARKDYICQKCREEIRKGEPYIWFKPLRSSRVKWHAYHGEPPRSMLTSSDKKKRVYEAQEALLAYMEDALLGTIIRSGPDKIMMSRRLMELNVPIVEAQITGGLVADEYYESAKNVSTRFGNTPLVEDCNHKADAIHEWIDWLRYMNCEAGKLAIDLLETDDSKKRETMIYEFLDRAFRTVGSLSL